MNICLSFATILAFAAGSSLASSSDNEAFIHQPPLAAAGPYLALFDGASTAAVAPKAKPKHASGTRNLRSTSTSASSNGSMKSQITSLQLVNAVTDQAIVALEDGMVIALDAISGMTVPSFNINALVNGTDIKTVKFGYNSTANYRTEDMAPFAFCGNNGTNFFACKKLSVLGTHTVTATPRSRNGQVGRSVTFTFTVIESDVVAPRLLNFRPLTPTTVDISNGNDADVVFEITVQDEASGFMYGSLQYVQGPWFLYDFNTVFGNEPTMGYRSIPSIQAINNDVHVFNVTARVRQNMAPGVYPILFYTTDYMFNFGMYEASALAEMGHASEITIVNTGLVDTTAPQVVAVSTSSPSLTVPTNSTVTFDVVFQDDLSGVDFGYIHAMLMNSTDYTAVYVEFGKAGTGPEGGTGFVNNGPELEGFGMAHAFVVNVAFDESMPAGDYQLEVGVSDAVKHWTMLEMADLEERGFPSVITLY